jgi:hypothetical protein
MDIAVQSRQRPNRRFQSGFGFAPLRNLFQIAKCPPRCPPASTLELQFYYQEQKNFIQARQAERKKMVQHIVAGNPVENKYQHLRKIDGHLRAEIKISRDGLGYQFKLRQIDDNQGCFFVSENSAVLKILDVGSVLDMKYWTADKTRTVKYVTAEINDIAKQNRDPFKGHFKVGLSILKTKSLKRVNPLDGLLKARIEAQGLGREQRAQHGL